ncbi:MAG: hypothetical protein JWM11_6693 [Planctomycetaceae bacterium]|nr:hypothetical protein [Planctomycetaceae bacterium]
MLRQSGTISPDRPVLRSDWEMFIEFRTRLRTWKDKSTQPDGPIIDDNLKHPRKLASVFHLALKQQMLETTLNSALPNSRVRQRLISGFTLIELLVVMAIISVLIALLLPAVQQSREAARRMQCKNNLMNVGLALSQYEMSHERLPPGSVNATGPIKNEPTGYHMGWIVQILPQLDQRNVYRKIDFSVSVYDPKNAPATGIKLSVLTCPSDPLSGPDTSYAGNHHDSEAPIDLDNNGVLFLNSSIRFDEVGDGTSNTIFIGERIRGSMTGWASGTRVSLRNGGAPIGSEKPNSMAAQPAGPQPIPLAQPVPANAVNQGLLKVGGFGSHHVGGCHFALGDASVRFTSESIDRTVLKYLLNRNDGNLPADF